MSAGRGHESSRWQLDEWAFKTLLSALAADGAGAAHEYERLRQRLVRYFGLHGVPQAAEATDEAFNRLAKRLSEGEPIQNLEAYLAGIARLVMLEERQRLTRERQILLRLVPEGTDNEEEGDEVLLAALESCLLELPEAIRAQLTRYYAQRGLERVRAREALARELGVSQNSLRNRMLRLRQRLERAVRIRLDALSGEAATRSATQRQEAE